MCLTSLSDKPKLLPTYRQRIGWKIFKYEPDKDYVSFTFFNHHGKYKVATKRWLTSTKLVQTFITSGYYPRKIRYAPRFHIYLSKPKLNRFHICCRRVYKVQFKYPVAIGYQSGGPVVVATKMKVLKVEKV